MAKNISSLPGIYIHIPFCEHKCGYCDFYSITDFSSQKIFVRSLIQEIRRTAAKLDKQHAFDTIYFGGGTPSLLEIAELDELLQALHESFKISRNAEITLETNPGTVNLSRLKAFKDAGINRLSIGIQSFRDEELTALERIHSAEQARRVIKDSRRAGFDNISIDLIFALPGQQPDHWLNNLESGLEFEPEHISAYNLIFEEGTPFYRKMLNGKIVPQMEKQELQFFKMTIEKLEENGYLPYEVSSYARDESYFSRHNCKYWDHTNYLGFGPSAHSFWGDKRWANTRSLSTYLRKIKDNQFPVVSEETIDRDTREFESILLGLRTYAGLDLREYRQQFGQPFTEKYQPILEKLTANGLAHFSDHHFCLTQNGMYICDEIIQQFIDN